MNLLDSLRRLAATLVAIVETRLALLSTDLEEAGQRVAAVLLWGIIAVYCFSVGVLLAVMLVVAMFWDTHRLLALALASTLFLALSAGIAFAIARWSRRQARLFATSLKELAKDRDHLVGKP